MEKLQAKVTHETEDNELINVEFIVKGKVIESVELYLFNDIADGCENDEYLLKFYRNDDEDPEIITQGNI